MNDLFSSYGETAQPTRKWSSREKPEKPLSAFDKKMREKGRLNKAARLAERKRNREALRAEPRLVQFMKYLRTVQPQDSDALIDAIACSWLPAAALNVRIFALRMIDARANFLNRRLGNEALDDPFPVGLGGYPSVYFRARDFLHEGGRR